MRYIDCCKSTRKNKKCTRKDGKHFSLQRRFTKKKCIKGPVKGFTMRASCAPYKFCKQKGGAKKTRKLLPKLRKISYKNKKHHYKLKDPFRKRKLAIHEGVNREAKKTGKTKKKAAIAKKGRFNILRIYRKNKKIKECNTITHDMRYMDRKYGLGKTKNICGQKGGTYEFPPDRPDSTFSNIDDLKFILSFYSPHNNNKIIIKSYTGDEDEHQLKPELASDTHILIVGADYGIPFFLFQGAGFEIKPKGVEEYLRYVEPIDQSGGKNRKRKTRKKKKQFLYNPDDPSKSFDVYIDKNPKDTIPIKYTTVKDVKDTIKKLERLYKTKKYPHKRIWQVGMIMKVRLEAMLKHKTKKYPNAKKVKQRFNLANKYFKFLGKRTKKKDFKSRKSMKFKF